MRVLSAIWWGLVWLVCVCWGCSRHHDVPPQGKHIFRFTMFSNITSLDPAFARSQANIWAVHQLYNGLLQLNERMEVVPCIAKSWVPSDDGLRYTFVLRDDVYFHDNACFEQGKGRRVKASDVVFSFARLLDEQVSAPGSWVFKGRVADSQPFVALNDTTFVLQLNKPFHPLLSLLTGQYCSIVAPEAVAYYDERFRANPVGTGAFQLKKWYEGQALVLEKNIRYFEKDSNNVSLPYVDGAVAHFASDRSTGFLQFIKHKSDFMSGLNSAYTDQLLDKQGDLLPHWQNEIQYQKTPYLNVEYIGIRQNQTANKALNDVRVRQALNYAIDREQMLAALRNKVGIPANAGIVPKGLPAYNPLITKGYTYNPAKARALLAQAGYPDGNKLPTITITTNTDYQDLITFVAKQWNNLGISTKIELSESATLRERMAKEQIDVFRASWIADYPDEENFLSLFYSQNPAPPNYTRFNNPHFDALYEAALKEPNDSIRRMYYHQMDNLLIEQAPVVFLFYDESARFLAPTVRQFANNSLNLPAIKYAKLNQ